LYFQTILRGSLLTIKSQGLSSIGYVAQSVAFVVLVFCVPIMFPRTKEIIKLLKTVVVLFIPVAAYAIYQFYAGLSDFELDYLHSGFTGEARHLERGSGVNVYRLNSSTLNSTAAVSAILCLFAFILMPGISTHFNRAKPIINGIFGAKGLFVILLFSYAAFTTYTRSGWFGGIVSVLAWLMFSNKITTLALYLVGILGVMCLFLFPNQIEKEFKAGLFGSASSEAENFVLTTSTWQARLLGFQNLQDEPQLWTPWGLEAAGRGVSDQEFATMTHDIITSTILKYGYVVTTVVSLILFIIATSIHRMYFNMRKGVERNMSLLLLAGIIGILAGGLTNQSALSVYPINFYLWFFVGSLISVVFEERSLRELEKNVQPTILNE